MRTNAILRIGMTSDNGQVTIVDEDKLCYIVKSKSKGAQGLRTISKKLLQEFVEYVREHPETSSNEARAALTGKSDIDKFEYGYCSTLLTMAHLYIASERKMLENMEEEEHLGTNTYNFVQGTEKYAKFIAAIRTKPFLLLAGISGTGKSRVVRELARACWSMVDDNIIAHSPENFAMIPVRPNWHDGSELTGFWSNHPTYHYEAGDFLKFVVKAWTLTKQYGIHGRDIPCFLCLDEMNLAPVEQYFAEYLSCIESRDNRNGYIQTDALVKPLKEKSPGEAADPTDPYYILLCNLLKGAGCPKDKFSELLDRFCAEGITIPRNLIVIGTVNMDETTFSFSRKVLDRAMTIEMNEVDLLGGIGGVADVVPDLSDPHVLPLLATRIKAEDIYNDGNESEMESMHQVIAWLQAVNDKLEGSPFKIAYRTRNEVVLYVINSEALGKDRLKAFDEAMNMKILPRIEGDARKVGDVLDDLIGIVNDFYSDAEKAKNSPSLSKLKEMKSKMIKQYYCTYWN